MARQKQNKRFKNTPEGRKQARKWAKSVGKLSELDALRSAYESEGWSQVEQCNVWFREMRRAGKI